MLGDYGAGPNHTLPTSGTARFAGGLSTASFLVPVNWVEYDDASLAELDHLRINVGGVVLNGAELEDVKSGYPVALKA